MYTTFAWRYFKAKKSANAINIIAWVTIGVIAFATCCQLLVLSVFNGFESLVKDSYNVFYSDIKIAPAKGKTFELQPDIFAKIKQNTDVQNISAVVEEKALLQNDDAQTTVFLKGVDEAYKLSSGLSQKISKGVYEIGDAQYPSLIVGAGIEDAVAINIEGAFASTDATIILPKKNSAAANPTDLLSEGNIKAKGVFTIQQEFDNKYAITNIDFVRQQMNLKADEYTAVEIWLKPNVNPTEIKESITQVLGKNYLVQTKYEQNTSLYSTMQLEKWAIYAVLTLILIIAAFNMISALTMLVLEKQKDITILKSIGATEQTVLKIFLCEGILLGLLGLILGISLALLICFVQIRAKLIKLNGGSFLVNYFPVKIQIQDILLVAATAIIIATIAALLPALKASKSAINLK